MNPLPRTFITSIILFASSAFAAPPAYISLLPGNSGDLVSGTESQDAYCERTKMLSYVKCSNDGIAWSLSIYEAPQESAKKMGELIVTKIRKGLIVASFKDKKGKVTQIPIPSELASGEKFELTAIDHQGNWIQIPKGPFKAQAWINPNKDWNLGTSKILKPIETKKVYSSKALGDIVFTDLKQSAVTYREEYPNDMLCEKEFESSLKEPTKKTIPLKNLFDKDGHLTIFVKYPYGCG